MRQHKSFPQTLMGLFWLISLVLTTNTAHAQSDDPREIEHYEVIRLVNNGDITSLDTHLTRLNLTCNLVDAVLLQSGSSLRYDLHLMTHSGEAIFIEINAKTGEIYSPEANLTGCI